MTKKLTGHPKAQAHVEITDKNHKTLVSYKTAVATISPDGWLTINGLYSMTTRKHIMAFLNEYAFGLVDFPTVKKMVGDRFRLNIETGEVQDLAS